MAETHGFIRVPADGAGKRMAQTVLMEVSLKNLSEMPRVGENASFGTSTLIGVFSEVEQTSSTSADVHISLKDPIADGVFLVADEIVFQNEIPIGLVTAPGTLFYIQQNVIVGGADNTNHLDVDDLGAASVRFPEGAPQFDAFGKLQSSAQTALGDYTFHYDTDSERWNSITSGSGTITHDVNKACLVLSTGSLSGDLAERITHNYHHYHLGNSQLILLVAQFGDTGKAGNKRIVGYGDDDNGIFFMLNGTQFGAMIRSNSTGSVVETFVPKNEWNTDRLDGSYSQFNRSSMNLDVTKINTYWMDMQWMGGSGRVRFGVYHDGKRIVCHTMDHANRLISPFISDPSLPACVENRNAAGTASSSEIKVWSVTIRCEGDYRPTYRHFSAIMPKMTLTSTSLVPLGSFRAAALYKGKVNRISGYGDEANMFSTTAPIRVVLLKNATLTGASWFPLDPNSSVEGDMAATSYTGGTVLRSAIFPNGQSAMLKLESVFNLRGESLRLNQDGVTVNTYTFAVQLLTPGTTDVYFTPFWKEI